jgi:hypothetical protein
MIIHFLNLSDVDVRIILCFTPWELKLCLKRNDKSVYYKFQILSLVDSDIQIIALTLQRYIESDLEIMIIHFLNLSDVDVRIIHSLNLSDVDVSALNLCRLRYQY